TEVLLAHHAGAIGLQEWVRVRIRAARGSETGPNGEMVVTTPGRVLFNQVLPVGRPPIVADGEVAEGVEPLAFQNGHFDRKELRALISTIFRLYGNEVTAETANEIKRLGFGFATRAGITISAMDIPHPATKAKI